jgi:hypothetical protein
MTHHVLHEIHFAKQATGVLNEKEKWVKMPDDGFGLQRNRKPNLCGRRLGNVSLGAASPMMADRRHAKSGAGGGCPYNVGFKWHFVNIKFQNVYGIIYAFKRIYVRRKHVHAH